MKNICPMCGANKLSKEVYLDEIEGIYYNITITICNICEFMWDENLLFEKIK